MLYICPWHARAFPPEKLISSMITDASASPRPDPPCSKGISAASQPAAERLDERVGIAARLVHTLPVRGIEAGAEGPQRLTQFLV